MSIKNLDAYMESIGKMDEIRKYCNENNIADFHELYTRAKEEKPEWIKTLNRTGVLKALDRYFYKKEISRRHKEAMAIESSSNGKAKAVVCIDNGMEFKSINEATRWLGIKNSQMVSDCCRGVIDNVRGYHFLFIGEEKNE